MTYTNHYISLNPYKGIVIILGKNYIHNFYLIRYLFFKNIL